MYKPRMNQYDGPVYAQFSRYVAPQHAPVYYDNWQIHRDPTQPQFIEAHNGGLPYDAPLRYTFNSAIQYANVQPRMNTSCKQYYPGVTVPTATPRYDEDTESKEDLEVESQAQYIEPTPRLSLEVGPSEHQVKEFNILPANVISIQGKELLRCSDNITVHLVCDKQMGRDERDNNIFLIAIPVMVRISYQLFKSYIGRVIAHLVFFWKIFSCLCCGGLSLTFGF
mmetsp:Transcript_14315/g.15873  ORF Transcript_14315/g.15873 Transcript_14315/m.15873 type:complete len:224 (+) Transcript_14315:36-707(+)